MRFIVACLFALFIARPCFAWSEGGHHLIAVMACHGKLLTGKQAVKVIKLLYVLDSNPQEYPAFKWPNLRKDEEFIPEFWLLGRAGCWPDLIRGTNSDRPNWHWQLGATLVIENPSVVPQDPGPVPAGSTLATKDLHLAQAVELCREIVRDKSNPVNDRAIALCWLLHLVADAHQPCHCGSLYTENLFPKGDRGANEIPTKQRKNLHALWDSLLGPKWDAKDLERRSKEIKSDPEIWERAIEAAKAEDGLNPMTWISEGRQIAKEYVYAPEVLAKVQAAESFNVKLEPIELSEEYLKSAGKMARMRAALAATRLAKLLTEALQE